MDKKYKILKAVLLLRKFNRYQSKEEQIAETTELYSGPDMEGQLDEWIESLKEPEQLMEPEDYEDYEEEIQREEWYTSSSSHDYSPSNPWDAPGMSIRDFI